MWKKGKACQSRSHHTPAGQSPSPGSSLVYPDTHTSLFHDQLHNKLWHLCYNLAWNPSSEFYPPKFVYV